MKVKIVFSFLLFISISCFCLSIKANPGYDSIAIVKYDTITRVHFVKSGQTLTYIAKLYNCSVSKLVSMNRYSNKEYKVKIGEKVLVPFVRKTVTMKYMMPQGDGGMPPPKNQNPVKELENNADTSKLESTQTNVTTSDNQSTRPNYINTYEEDTIDILSSVIDTTNSIDKSVSDAPGETRLVNDSLPILKDTEMVIDTVLPNVQNVTGKDTLTEEQKIFIDIKQPEPKSNKEEKKKVKEKDAPESGDHNILLKDEATKEIEIPINSETDTLPKIKSRVLKTVNVNDVKVKKKKTVKGIEVSPLAKEKASFYLARAMKSIDVKDYKSAEIFTKKALDINPNYCEAWMLHADLNNTFGYFDRAIKDYTNAIEADKQMIQAYYNRGSVYLKMSELDKAYADFNKCIRMDSTYILALGGRASIRMYKKEYIDAIKDFTTILSLNKYFSPAYKARGIARLEIGDYTEAIADFNEYLKIDKKDAYVYYQKGLAELKAGKMYDCCLDLLKSSELGNTDAKAAIKKYCD